MDYTVTRRAMLALTASFAVFGSSAMAQDVPAGYPADYATLIEAAKAEGTVSIYTSTDAEQSQALQDAFTAKYGIAIAYNDLGTNGSYNQVISEAAANQVTADLVWSSAMDLQMTLVADGYTEAYASPESANIPAWANYKDSLYGTTVEPIGMIYNTIALPADRIPKTRADLIKFLTDNQAELQGKIATFDPEKSGTGFLHHTNDARQTSDWWDLFGPDEGNGCFGRERTGDQHHRLVCAGMGEGKPELGRGLWHGLYPRLLPAGDHHQRCASPERGAAVC
jgi:iron(III) transport system substrate-binding protein